MDIGTKVISSNCSLIPERQRGLKGILVIKNWKDGDYPYGVYVEAMKDTLWFSPLELRLDKEANEVHEY